MTGEHLALKKTRHNLEKNCNIVLKRSKTEKNKIVNTFFYTIIIALTIFVSIQQCIIC